MHSTPHQVDTVEKIRVPVAQDDPAVVEDGRQEQAHQERETGYEEAVAVGNDGSLEYGQQRQRKREIAHGRVGVREGEP